VVRRRHRAVRLRAEPAAHAARHGARFEDGTLNYLGIAAVAEGLRWLADIGIDRINAHVMRLTNHLLAAVENLRHTSGAPMVRIYGAPGMDARGATVAFNLLDPQSELVDFREVERRASEAGISLRTGFFCNPGAAEFAFEYPDEEAFRCIQTLTPESFNLQVFSDCMHDHAVGAVRVSMGIASTEADLGRLLDVLGTFRDQDAAPMVAAGLPGLATVD
jgi:selenocysteine lyase/cysteine desulfurase